jgi:hypothetical protein
VPEPNERSAHSKLVGANALRGDVNQPWEQDNQAWWDWYLTLADNGDAPRTPLRDATPLPSVEPISDEAIVEQLRTPFPLTEADRAFFRANGFVKLRAVLSPEATLRLRQEIVRLLSDAFDLVLDGGTSERFLSLELAWLEHQLLREYVLSPRIAKIAADLLDVPRVRLYHDNLMSKEPGCGRTPWHYDDHHFPLATQDVVTAWIPAQPIPKAMGPLAFAYPIATYKLVESVAFNKFDTSYDRQVMDIFRRHRVAIEDGPFEIGEISFHHNLSFHTAAANRTRQSRVVLANTFYADGARVIDQPTMVSGDWQKFIPDTKPGEIAASKLNPICWPVEHPADV